MVEVCFADIAEKRDGVLSLISVISDFILVFNKQNLFRDLLSRDSLNGIFHIVYSYQNQILVVVVFKKVQSFTDANTSKLRKSKCNTDLSSNLILRDGIEIDQEKRSWHFTSSLTNTTIIEFSFSA